MDGEQSSADREHEERKAEHARHEEEQQTEGEREHSEERSEREGPIVRRAKRPSGNGAKPVSQETAIGIAEVYDAASLV